MLTFNLIKVELTPNIASALRFMVESGVFDIKDGSATLHFGSNGRLNKIERKLYTVAPAEDLTEAPIKLL
jgi:hypothetical protein